MFLVRLRFHSRLSLLYVICNEYEDTIVKLVCIFEKVDFKHCKAALDLDFFKLACPLMLSENICYFILQTKGYEDHKPTKSV